MSSAYAECHRRFHPIKQAIALATCENRDRNEFYDDVPMKKIQERRNLPADQFPTWPVARVAHILQMLTPERAPRPNDCRRG